MALADLIKRSENKCELCGSPNNLKEYEVSHWQQGLPYPEVLLCGTCLAQVEKKDELNSAHLQCLTTAMWSEVPAVQVLAWRMLNRLRAERWATESIDMMYLDDAVLAWAKASGDHESDDTVTVHRDANGNRLEAGDTVILTKSLDVKGASLNARMGTVVKNIRLVAENTEQIEGRIEGQVIVILTKYVRKHAG